MSETLANQIAKNYFGVPLGWLPPAKVRQIVEVARSGKGDFNLGFPGLPEPEFSLEEIHLAQAIIDELEQSRARP